MGETAKRVVPPTATNVAGFGTLTLADYPAMWTVGVMALIGSITCLFTALTLVPGLMVRRIERSETGCTVSHWGRSTFRAGCGKVPGVETAALAQITWWIPLILGGSRGDSGDGSLRIARRSFRLKEPKSK